MRDKTIKLSRSRKISKSRTSSQNKAVIVFVYFLLVYDEKKNMGKNFLDQAEVAARSSIEPWIQKGLRECFLQALRQSWILEFEQNQSIANSLSDSSSSSSSSLIAENRNGTQLHVEMSTSDVYACFSAVERLSNAWQSKLRKEHHDNVAQWVAEVYQHGKLTLWIADEDSKRKPHNKNTENNIVSDLEKTNDDNHREDISDSMNNQKTYPWIYSKLRSVGRKTKLDSPLLSAGDALHEIKKFTRKHPTYWPQNISTIDQESLNMTHRMRSRDRHASSKNNVVDRDGSCSKKKTVQFKVVPRTTWDQQQHHRDQLGSNNAQEDPHHSAVVEVLLTARGKKNVNGGLMIDPSLRQTRKRTRISEQQDSPRPPFDLLASSNENVTIDLSIIEKKKLDKLLILDDDEKRSPPDTDTLSTTPSVILGLFGGLKHVGETNYALQKHSESKNNSRRFNTSSRDNASAIRKTRRKCIQERLGPNRRHLRDEAPKKLNSKLLRTQNCYDGKERCIDLDLGWCLLEVIDGHEKEMTHKKLCAFSSMEICLNDHD